MTYCRATRTADDIRGRSLQGGKAGKTTVSCSVARWRSRCAMPSQRPSATLSIPLGGGALQCSYSTEPPRLCRDILCFVGFLQHGSKLRCELFVGSRATRRPPVQIETRRGASELILYSARIGALRNRLQQENHTDREFVRPHLHLFAPWIHAAKRMHALFRLSLLGFSRVAVEEVAETARDFFVPCAVSAFRPSCLAFCLPAFLP